MLDGLVRYFDLYSNKSNLSRPRTLLWTNWRAYDAKYQPGTSSKSKRQATIPLSKKVGKEDSRQSATLERQGAEQDSATETRGDVEEQDFGVINAEYVDVEEQGVGESHAEHEDSERPVARLASKPKHRIAFGQWLALFAGVVIQPFFQTYQSTHKWAFDGLLGWSLFALITSVLIFPAVYRNAFDSDKPVIVQLAPIFAAGLGWQSLLTTVVKAASSK